MKKSATVTFTLVVTLEDMRGAGILPTIMLGQFVDASGEFADAFAKERGCQVIGAKVSADHRGARP